ncbi:MAG: hypothetical protein AAF709_19825 [Pseudomonadota bacterium]
MRSLTITTAVLSFVASAAGAATVLGTGGAITLTASETDGIVVRNDTDVTQNSGTSVSVQSGATPGAIVEDTSTLSVNGTITGGELTNAERFEQAGDGVQVQDDGAVFVSGGTVIGGAASGFEDPEGGFGISATGNSTVSVTGGLVIGGAGSAEDEDGRGGDGIRAFGNTTILVDGGIVEGGTSSASDDDSVAGQGVDASGNAMVTLQSGEIRGGSTATGEDAGLALLLRDDASFHMTGGKLVGGDSVDEEGGAIAANGTGLASITIEGGEISTGAPAGFFGSTLLQLSQSSLNISGGTFTSTGQIVGDFQSTGTISGGTFIGSNPSLMFALFNSTFDISGGTFTPGSDAFRTGDVLSVFGSSLIDISGGMFNGDFSLGGTTDLIVRGSNLSFENGFLTGILADSSAISVNIQLFDDAEVILAPVVPLPAGWLFLATGIGALTWRRLAETERRSAPAATANV